VWGAGKRIGALAMGRKTLILHGKTCAQTKLARKNFSRPNSFVHLCQHVANKTGTNGWMDGNAIKTMQ
jgi:hypothetical protein